MMTGCGTESNNWAIRSALLSAGGRADEGGLLHVVTSNIEHPAITECLKSYMEGYLTPKITVTCVEANREGIVSTEDVINASVLDYACLSCILL